MYAQIPTDALSDRMLLPVDKVILGLLADHDNGSYSCWPTNAILAAEAGCCVKTVYLALRRLQRLGWITVEPCATVERGQVIRLMWRRPAPGRKAQAKAKAGGGRQSVTGGVGNRLPGGSVIGYRQSRPSNQTQKTERARAGGEEEQTSDTLSPEEVAWWEGVAGGGDRTKANLARAILKKHAEETAARGNAPG